MIGGVNCRGGLPGVPDRVTVSARAKFCQGGVTRLAGIGFVLHQTRAKSFWRRLFFLIKRLDSDKNAPGHSTERLQQERQVSVGKH